MIIVWSGVGYFAWAISSAEAGGLSQIVSMEQESAEYTAVLRQRAVARETKEARATLENIADADVVQMLETIEAVAEETRIPIQVGQGLSVSTSGSVSPVRSVSFIVEAQGTFAQVVHTAALLESLPAPASFGELQLERLSSASGGSGQNTWRMVARVRIFTTADIPVI